ncbi:MAG TPA: SpoIID/LytB domain-containing protein [Vicinamibacterales bacterium]|nr:SpoIID/LytB domain-containing protein [Vicinamibacterales bacterium]
MRQILLGILLLLFPTLQQSPVEPIVRIGLTQNAATVTIRSARAFTVAGRTTRAATFAAVLAVDPNAKGPVAAADLQHRITARLDDGTTLVMPADGRVRIEPPAAPLEIEARAYRGALEIFGNSRRTLTVVNELPLEEYLRGVVPNELNPAAFGQLEALKAQAVAARTYIQRNLGQYSKEGYDICATDACQVYFGVLTEDALATQAVLETRGVVATYDGRTINALYSSTCGGRTEDAEHIFTEKVPYLVSVSCEYKHPRMAFETVRAIPNWKDGVVAVAGVKNFSEAAKFMGLPSRGEHATTNADTLATFIRETFYPSVVTASDLSFVREQGILTAGEDVPLLELLFRLIDKKSAFEWQQGVLESFDADSRTLRLVVGGQRKAFTVAPNALVYQRVGDSRLPLRTGAWIGGELVDFRAEAGVIPMLVYRINFANPAADRYSRVALWQVRKTKAELDTAFRSLAIGEFRGMRVIQRGLSERLVSTELTGTTGRATVPALRLRTLLSLRDSLFSYDIERNASGTVVGATFFGRGWGHGVGMCQVGAYGMALAGATYEEILKKYYTGIALQKLY